MKCPKCWVRRRTETMMRLFRDGDSLKVVPVVVCTKHGATPIGKIVRVV